MGQDIYWTGLCVSDLAREGELGIRSTRDGTAVNKTVTGTTHREHGVPTYQAGKGKVRRRLTMASFPERHRLNCGQG